MTIQLYCFGESGNAYKVALMLETFPASERLLDESLQPPRTVAASRVGNISCRGIQCWLIFIIRSLNAVTVVCGVTWQFCTIASPGDAIMKGNPLHTDATVARFEELSGFFR